MNGWKSCLYLLDYEDLTQKFSTDYYIILTYLEPAPADGEDERVVALQYAPVPAVALHTRRDKTHGRFVGK